jgi:hypothetical protein
MPNYCNNYITIKFNSDNDLHNFEKDFLNFYECFEKEIRRKGTRGIVVKTVTRWKPDFEWLEKILYTYDKCWIKNDWNEEGGIAGVWVGQYEDSGIVVINEMKWNDLCVEDMALLF